MRHLVWGCAVALAVIAPVASAQEWQTLTDADALVTLLVEHDLEYPDGATQQFMASGRTLYNAGEPSWGYWRVEDGQYCSQWPPRDDWACYAVAFDGVDAVQFTDPWGDASVGRFTE